MGVLDSIADFNLDGDLFNDFYLPLHYLQNTVLALRQKVGAPFRAVKFEGSPHVVHLRNHNKVNTEEILGFVTEKPKRMEMDKTKI